LHADEVDTSACLVRRLLASQFPHWAELCIEPVPSDGTENALYRLGGEMVVRLPRRPGATEQIEKLHRWLPRLAPLLPLAVPAPLAMGQPTEEYPCPWSVYAWLEGETARDPSSVDPGQAARALGHFLAALRRIDPEGGPRPGSHNFFRGVALAARDAHVRRAIEALGGRIDTRAATAAWEAALRTPVWRDPPVWIHGDIKADNLLVAQGRITGVIDFGGLGVGDPACDLIVAWDLFTATTRKLFRAAVAVDDATWARGRGWALSVALMALPYYLDTNPGMVRYGRRLLDEVCADPGSDSI
jgi:aminoglycoside phosphotransferase (APT) family kinase protein